MALTSRADQQPVQRVRARTGRLAALAAEVESDDSRDVAVCVSEQGKARGHILPLRTAQAALSFENHRVSWLDGTSAEETVGWSLHLPARKGSATTRGVVEHRAESTLELGGPPGVDPSFFLAPAGMIPR